MAFLAPLGIIPAMSKEHGEKTERSEQYIPATVCPDCVEAGLQVDPRAKTPAYPVIESVCSTHLIIKGDF